MIKFPVKPCYGVFIGSDGNGITSEALNDLARSFDACAEHVKKLHHTMLLMSEEKEELIEDIAELREAWRDEQAARKLHKQENETLNARLVDKQVALQREEKAAVELAQENRRLRQELKFAQKVTGVTNDPPMLEQRVTAIEAVITDEVRVNIQRHEAVIAKICMWAWGRPE
jgi:chromosome segregation ATPase